MRAVAALAAGLLAVPVWSGMASASPLLVGTVLPNTGDLAAYGPGTQAAARLAVADLVAAGAEVTLLPGDSGDTNSATLSATVARLKSAGVQALVGPLSSTLLLRNLSVVAGLPVVSPATTSPLLTGKIARVVPSDALQGAVLVKLASFDLAVKVVAVGPASSKATLDRIVADARLRGMSAVKVSYPDSTRSITSYAATVAAKHADAIVFTGGAETPALIRALVKVGLPAHVYFTTSSGAAAATGSYAKGTLTGAKVLGPDLRTPAAFKKRVLAVNPKVKQFDYTTQTYDATMVVALAAAEAGDPANLGAHLASVTTGGQSCSTAASCLSLIGRGADIDYRGVSGPVDLSENGEPVAASYSMRTFGLGNKPGTSLRYVRYP